MTRDGKGDGDSNTGIGRLKLFLSVIVPVVSFAIILTVIIIALAICCWRRSKCKRADLEAENHESIVVEVEEDSPKKDDPDNIVDNASGELVARPNWNLPPQDKVNEEYEHGSSHKDTNETEIDQFTNRKTNRKKDLPKYQISRKVGKVDVHEELTAKKTAPEKFVVIKILAELHGDMTECLQYLCSCILLVLQLYSSYTTSQLDITIPPTDTVGCLGGLSTFYCRMDRNNITELLWTVDSELVDDEIKQLKGITTES